MPKRWPFFYGYWVVVCATVGIALSAPGQTIGVSVFTDSLIENLGVSRLALSTAYMVGTILSSFFMVRLGVLIDRRGSRQVAIGASLGLAATLVLLSQIDRLARSLSSSLGLSVGPAVALVTVTCAFSLVRFFGQGALTLASRTMLMQWFEVARGRMNAIAGLATALMFSGAPWCFEQLIQNHGWRGAWWILAALLGLGMTTFAALFFRDNPESCGLHPDGVEPTTEEAGTSAGESEVGVSWTVAEAKKTYSFWAFNLGLALLAFYSTALMFHVVSIFEHAGRGRAEAVSIFLPAAAASVLVNLLGGFLADRYQQLKFHLLALVGGVLVSCLGVLNLEQEVGKWLIILGQGLSGGMFSTLISLTWPRFFGRLHLGALSGVNMGWLVFFSAVGPFLFGLSEDLTQGYQPAVMGSLFAALVLAGVALRADPPRRGHLLSS